MPVKRTQRTEIVGFALCAALCGIPAICIAGPAQDQAPAAEHKQKDRDKDRNAQDERKEPDPARHGRASMRRRADKIMLQKRSREIAAQNRQPKNGKAARQLNSSRATRRENGSIMARRRSIENRLLRVVHTGLHQMPTINFGVKIRPDCASISKVSLLGWIAATGHTS
jgi:hypothetical protein